VRTASVSDLVFMAAPRHFERSKFRIFKLISNLPVREL
jgi:hypothetical protein